MTKQMAKNILDDTNLLVKEAEEFALSLAKAHIKTHQLRRIYEAVQGIHASVNSVNKGELTQAQQDKLTFLKPQLAYIASKNSGLNDFYKISCELIGEIGNNYRNLDNFYRFFQSILAYHKYYSDDEKLKEAK